MTGRIQRKNHVKVTMWAHDGCSIQTEGGSVAVMLLMFSLLTDEQHDRLIQEAVESRAKRRASQVVKSED